MFPILKKEITSFFSTPIGYLVVGVFLITNGLFLWVFKSEFNIIDMGFADLNGFFFLSPWLMLFLIPAVTMKLFSDEKRLGTLELLFTKPISNTELVLGKYLGGYLLAIIAIIPTIIYVYTIYVLGKPVGNIDLGSVMGSYLGLLFLMGTYTAIGLFASTLSENQIVSFIIAVVICFFLLYGFDLIGDISGLSSDSLWITKFGMKLHYDSISRGVIDSRDILYFISVSFFFLFVTTVKLKKAHQ